MAELSDLMYKFTCKCKKCSAELTTDSILETVSSYGIILLVGKKNSFIGWSCPACIGRTTNLLKMGNDDFRSFMDIARSALFEQTNQLLSYRSFPYRLSFGKKDVEAQIANILNIDLQILQQEDFFSDPATQPANEYLSYDYSSQAMGPAFTAWGYDDSQIDTLIQLENKTGCKAFPRHIVYNPLYSTIDNFCWQNRVQLDFIKTLDLPFNVKR
jgi:hypothetical protein